MERFKGWSVAWSVAWSVTEDGAFQRIERFSVDWQSQSISNLEDAA